MATPGRLVAAFSEILGMPESIVRAHDRALSEAGLRTKKGRGVSAARMTSEDASWLLLSLLSGSLAKDAALGAEKYARLINIYHSDATSSGRRQEVSLAYKSPLHSGKLKLKAVDALGLGHSLFQMVDALIVAARYGQLDTAAVNREARRDPFGMVPLEGWSIGIRLAGPFARAEVRISCDGEAVTGVYAEDYAERPEGEDLTRLLAVSQETILRIGSLLRDESP